MTFLTTLLTTLLIAYRIHSVSKQDVVQRARKPFAHILQLLIQSAAAYSFAALFTAIVQVIPLTPTSQWTVLNVNNYSSFLFAFTAVFKYLNLTWIGAHCEFI